VSKKVYKSPPSYFGSFVGEYSEWINSDGVVPIMTDVYGTMPMAATPWISTSQIALKTDVPDVTQFLFLNGSRQMAGNLTMGGNYITGLLSGSSGGSVVNKTYVDEGLSGIVSTTNLSSIYPVGFVVITSNNVSPATSLGWGTWNSLGTGYVLVGIP
jgi:hypothetical protein